MKVNYLMRSLMFVPAHNDRLMNNASRSVVSAEQNLVVIKEERKSKKTNVK